MPILVQCPACGRKLRVPDELLGKMVRCPGCGGTFTGEAKTTEEAKTSAPEPEQKAEAPPTSSGIAGLDDLNLELGEESAPPPPAPAPPPPSPPSLPPSQPPQRVVIARPVPAPEPIHLKPANKPKAKPREEEDDGKEPCPYCGERIKRNSIRCKYCGEELDEEEDDHEEDDYEDDRPARRRRRRGRGIRRDSLPHRGSTVLTLGIISIASSAIALVVCNFLSFVGLGLGIASWVMGQRDLARMRTGEMDERGKGSTQGGWICGIIGTILGVLGLVVFVFLIIFFGFALFGAMSAKPSNPPSVQPGPMRNF